MKSWLLFVFIYISKLYIKKKKKAVLAENLKTHPANYERCVCVCVYYALFFLPVAENFSSGGREGSERRCTE